MYDIDELLKKRNYRQLALKNKEIQKYILDCVSWAEDIEEASYCLKHKIKSIPLCVVCVEKDKKCEFKKRTDGTMGYSTGCCAEHSRIFSNRIKYGVDNASQSEVIKQKKKSTTFKNYGVTHNSQSELIKQQKKSTTFKNYGVTVPLKSSEILNKVKKTNIKNYGVDSPIKNKVVMDKVKNTNIQNYGVDNPQKNTDIRVKTERTNLHRYGGITPMSCLEIKEKNQNSFKKSFFSKKIESLSSIVLPKFKISEYNGTDHYYNWQCVVCNNVFESHLRDGRIPRCYDCYPSNKKGFSKCEIDIFNLIKASDKIQSDRVILQGKELDIYIPSKKIAIEFNGIYWHSELNGKDKNYHLNKTTQCSEKGIQLIHVFESEWNQKRDIVESIINSKLGLFKTRIYAKHCIVRELINKEKNDFLNNNHLQGNDRSSVYLGLFFADELVSIMTFGYAQDNKKHTYEMHRFCTKIGYQIIGGVSKLWSYFVKTYNPKSVITYADRRYSDGTLYEKIGFKKIGISKPNYFYFKNGSTLANRLQFQKHKLKDKLEKFDDGLTEWENMQLNGYDRIWDCGDYVFSWSN